MADRVFRVLVPVLTAVVVFAAVAVVMMRVMPPPLRAADYLVAGTAATFAALLAVFCVLILFWLNRSDLFWKRRR